MVPVGGGWSSAETLPPGPGRSSESTRRACSSVPSPARSTAKMCKNASFALSSGTMNP